MPTAREIQRAAERMWGKTPKPPRGRSVPEYYIVGGAGGGGGPSYTLPTPFVIHDFKSATGWFPTSGGPVTITAETGGGLVFADTSPRSSGTATNHDVGTFSDPAGWGVVALLTDLGGPPAGGGSERDPQLMLTGSMGVRIGSGGSGGSGGTYNSTAGIGDGVSTLIENVGEYWSCGNVASLSGLPGAGTIGLRTEGSVSPGGRFHRQKLMLGNAAGRPTCLIRVDDALASVDPTMLNMFAYYGFKATFFIPWANLGTGGRLTNSQVTAIRNAGHAICLNLTEDDGVVTGLANPAAAIAKLNEGRTWLATNGFAAEGGNHVVYSNGVFGVNPTPVTKTDITGSIGSAVITTGSTTGITAGMRAVGVGVPNSPKTFVASVDSSTQLTLTQNLTVAHGGTGRIKFSDVSSPFYTRALQDEMAAAGVKTGWTTLGGAFYSRYGVGNRALVLPGNTTTSATVGLIEGYIDNAILRGATVQFYLHGITGTFNPADGTDNGAASSGLTIGTGVLNPALAYLKSKVDANLIDVMTVPDWWARDCASPATPPGL